MTAPAEDPRGGECPVKRTVYGNPCDGPGTYYCDSDVWGSACRRHFEATPPAAGRGDTDSGGEAVALNGHEVPVVVEPELEWRGTATWTPGYHGQAQPPVRIRLRNGPGDLDGRVLLHEVLHVLVGTDPQAVLPPDDPRHEDFVRMLTAGLHDAMGYRRVIP